MPKGIPCTDPSHTKYKNGRCRDCALLAWKKRKGVQHREGIVPESKSDRSVALRHSWVTRREKYGSRGISQEAAEHVREVLTRPRKRAKKCKRGHWLTPDNILMGGKGRMCRRCNLERSRGRAEYLRNVRKRPEWVTVNGAKINVAVHDAWVIAEGKRLLNEVVRLHPDKNPRVRTRTEFIKARKQWKAFLQKEKEWYKNVNLPFPKGLYSTNTPEQEG